MADDVGISLEAFSHVVDTIYAAALDPPKWIDVSRLVSGHTNSALAAFFIQDMSVHQVPIYYGHDVPSTYIENYQKWASLNPMLPSAALSNAGDLVVQSQIQTREEFVGSQFYREFVAPLGLFDSIGLTCLRTGSRIAAFAVNSSVGRPVYSQSEIALLRLLAPHFCRAMTIADALELRTIKAEALHAALDGLAAGVFMVDGTGRVVHMNRSAEHMVMTGNVLTVREGRLWPIAQSSREDLNAALATGRDRISLVVSNKPNVALRPADMSVGGMVATLLPLEQAQRASAIEPFVAQWAVFVQDPHVAMPMPGEAFGRLYTLTPAELRVALALASGLAPEQAADILGLALPTVRSHLQRLYIKTATNRQADLIQLMMSSAPPLRGRP